jgi:hypothetical protein
MGNSTKSGVSERITVKRASELTGLSQLTVREGIKSGRLEFGRAIPSKTGMHHTIHISPAKLAEYLGLTVEQVKGERNE